MNFNPEHEQSPEQKNARQAFATLSPDRILDAVESLGYQCNGRFLALNSYENRVYQIGLEDSEPLVAKFYRPGRWDDEAILEEHQYTIELAATEIPVVAPLVDPQGKTLHRFESHRFALYPNRGGRALELDDARQLEQLGRFMGRIHAMGSTADFKHRPVLDIQSFGIEPRAYLLHHPFIPDYLREAYRTVTADLLAAIDRSFAAVQSVSLIRLQGDMHPGNILYRDEIPHIVDFDDARMGPAVQDLWMFLSGEREYQNKRLGDLLVGYEQFFEFDPRELTLLEPLRALRMIHYAAWLARRWDDPAFPRAFPWFNTANYWEDHVLTLREQMAALNEPPLVW